MAMPNIRAPDQRKLVFHISYYVIRIITIQCVGIKYYINVIETKNAPILFSDLGFYII